MPQDLAAGEKAFEEVAIPVEVDPVVGLEGRVRPDAADERRSAGHQMMSIG